MNIAWILRAVTAVSLVAALVLSIASLVQVTELDHDMAELGEQIAAMSETLTGMQMAQRSCIDCRPWAVAAESK